ncbi:MAG: ABC transporter substrate-binding protein [Acidimicrobiia bacterium]
MRTRFKTGIALALVGALGMAACGGDDDDAGTTNAGSNSTASISAIVPTTAAADVTAAPSTAPSNANLDAELKYGWLSFARTLDPHRGSASDWVHLNPVLDRLTRIDENMQIVPMLASKWSFSPDGKTMTITLRKDILFQDSTPIDATAVKANLDRAKTLPDTGAGAGQVNTVKNLLAAISSIDVVDASTLRLNLSGSGATLPAALAGGAGMIMNPKAFANPAADLTTGIGEGNGSGPYRVTDFKSAESTSYERTTQKYWDPAAGLVKKFSLKFTGTSANALNGVKAGDYDLVQISGTDVATAQTDAKAGRIKSIEQLQLMTQQVLVFRSDRAGSAVNNKLFRQAVQTAIDKKAIGDGLFSGNCRPASFYYTPEHWSFSATTASQYSFDVNKAKALLQQSGVTNPTFQLTYTQGATVDPIAQAIKQQLANVGITVTLNPQPAANTAPPFQQAQTDAVMQSMSGFTNVEPSNWLTAYILDKATSGIQAGYDTDGSIAKAAAEAADVSKSLAERTKLYDAIWQKIGDQAWVASVCNSVQLWASNPAKNIVDKLQQRWVGLPDFRYVYQSK